MKVGLIGLTVAAATAPASFVSVQDDADLEARVEAIAEMALADGAAGLAVAIDVGGDEFLARGWGRAEGREQATADTAVRAGALTGPFLSVAILQLAEKEKLDLDKDVREVLADFPYEDETITVRQLLTHTSGLPSYADLLEARQELDAGAMEAVHAWLAERPLEASPGDCQELSPTNVLLLGLVLEEITDTSVPAYLAENVFAIAGMEGTRYCDDGPAIHELASFTQEFAGGVEDLSGVPQPFEAARLCTSARDLARWQRALVERTLVGDRSYRALTQPAALAGGETLATTCGLGLTPLGEVPCLSVGGSAFGGSVHLAYYPEMDLTIAVTAVGEDVDVRLVERRIARAFHHQPEPALLDVRLAPEMRARYVGTYYVGCTAYEIEEAGAHLRLAPPDGAPSVLLYQGEQLFVAEDDLELRLRFELEEGTVVGFQLDEHGATSRAKRLQ